MAFRERIELLVDIATGQSTTSLGKLRTEIGNTDGAFGKMKVASAGAWSMLQAHAVAGGAIIAAAAVAFAAKAVTAFQDTALGAGKLRDSLGLTAEEASRFQEVAGDLGIPVGALESTMGRMNREAAKSPELFDNIGAAIVRNKDGTINVQETFLSVVDALNRMPDASDRAAAAQKIFGRSWMQIAEMVGMGAKNLRRELGEVESQKVLTDDQIAKAREFRDKLDDLKGVVEGLTIAIGSELVDVILGVVEAFESASEAVEPVVGLFQKFTELPVVGSITEWLGPLNLMRKSMGLLGGAVGVLGDTFSSLWEDTFGSLGQVEHMEGTFVNLSRSMGDAGTAANGFEQRLAASTVSAEDAAKKQKELKERVDEFADTLRKTLEGAISFNNVVAGSDWGRAGIDAGVTSMQAYTAQVNGLVDIQAAREQAIDNLVAAMGEEAFSLDVTTEAGRRQRDALMEVAETVDVQLAAAYENADGNMATFKSSAETIANETLARLQGELGLSAEQVDLVRTSLGLTDGDWEARFKMAGTEEARIKVGLLGEAIAAVVDPEWQARVTQMIIMGDWQGVLNAVQQKYNTHPAYLPADAYPRDFWGAREQIEGAYSRNPAYLPATPYASNIWSAWNDIYNAYRRNPIPAPVRPFTPGFGGHAAGGIAPHMAMAGENSRMEFVNGALITKPTMISPGTRVTGEQQTELLFQRLLVALEGFGGGGGGTVINNWPAGSRAEDVIQAQRRYARRNGPT